MATIFYVLREVLKERKAKIIGFVVALVYFIFYLYSIGNITIIETQELLSFKVLDNWQTKIFKQIAPFLWEPIALLNYNGLALLFSLPNILLALLLAILVFFNIAVAVYSYHISKICNVSTSFKGILGFLPSFFTGFACCVPTFLIALGPVLASFTVFFIKLRPILIPLSLTLMILSIVWGTRRIPNQFIKTFVRRAKNET